MKEEKAQRSERKKTTSSQRERKTRETERGFGRKKEENPLRKRLKSEDNGDKRKVRRDFFTEKNENNFRSPRQRNFEDKERKTTRSRRDGDDFRSKNDKKGFPPHKRSDNEDNYSRKPVGRPRKVDNRFGDRGGYRPRRDDDRRESPRRRSDNDDSYSKRPVERPRKENNRFGDRDGYRPRRDDNRRDFSRRNRENENYSHRFDEEKTERKPVRHKAGMDSDIIRDIMHKRREAGRYSERKPKVLALSWNEDRGLIRLNKCIANSGICSRREADNLITAGAVTINGKIVTELGTKVAPTDEVRYEDKILQREKPIYILLNKPKDYITTTEDDRGRDNVMMLIKDACEQRVYPVGRLDRNTTGLLLFTNDGELTKKLTHPRFGIKKIYQVELDKDLKLSDFEILKNGIELEDGFMQPDELEYVNRKKVLGITLHSGKNRIVRRLFGHLGYEVEKLDRVYYAGLTKKNLARGEWRILQQEEVNMLKMSI